MMFRENCIQSVEARLERLRPQRDLKFEGAQRVLTVSSLDNENVSAYLVSLAQKALIALGSQPAAFSAKSIRGLWGYSVPEAKKIRVDYGRAEYPVNVSGTVVFQNRKYLQ